MKSFKKTLLTGLVLALTCAASPVKNNYLLSADHLVTIHGTSNLHNWDEKVGTVTGDGIVNRNEDGSFDLEAINIKMDVHSIKSDKGTIMNNNTYKALKADKNPQILFTLTEPVKSIQAKINAKVISAKGNFMIAGVTKSIEMKAKVLMKETEKLAFEGSCKIKMSDYNIDPPTAFFGTLKTGDEITINFKINFRMQASLKNTSNPIL